MKEKVRRILSVALVLAMTLLMGWETASQSLAEAQKKKAELEQSLAQAEALINELGSSQDQAEDKVAELNKELNNISQQIIALQQKLTEKNQQIVDSQEAVNAAQQEVNRRYEDMKKRIQFMYEKGHSSIFEQLITADSVAGFVNMAEYFSQVSKYDRGKVDEYQEAVTELTNAETTLKQEHAELETLKAEVEQDQAAVEQVLGSKQEELAAINKNLDSAQNEAASFEKEMQAQDEALAYIQAAEAEQNRQEAEQQKQEQANNGAGSGGNTSGNTTGKPSGDNSDGNNSGSNSTAPARMTWPVPASRRVTSDYGNRDNPTASTPSSQFHKGIDIGAPTGTTVVAAAAGKVELAQWSNSAGNWIIINHGGGVRSVYMHNSKLLVSAGQQVEAGQAISLVGSTGDSTGPHLHFGVSEGGSYVNPWNYLQ